MHPPSPSPVLRLHPCRRQWIGVLVLCLGLLGIGVAMLTNDAGAGWFVAAVSGVGAAAAIAALLPGVTYLQLDADGMTLGALFRRRRFDWTIIAAFGITEVAGQGRVGWNFHRGHPTQPAHRLSSRVCGFEAVLPDTYGLQPATLAMLLEHSRAAATESAPTALRDAAGAV